MTQSRLKELFTYDSDIGIFRNKVSRGAAKKGVRAGTETKVGYVNIMVDGKHYYEHRLAWIYMYGTVPEDGIDHINHCKADNRIKNLRAANHRDNGSNRPLQRNNKSGTHGVSKHRDKWRARITVGNKEIYLGVFNSKDEAIMAKNHANKLYGFHTNHGRC